jgi:hypothetical protein
MAILKEARKQRAGRLLSWLAAALLMVSTWGWATESRTTPEYQAMAAFLLNFTRFVEWPATAFAVGTSPLTICVLGDDLFGDALDQVVEGESAGGRKLEVRRIHHPPTAKSCQVLFVGRSEKDVSKVIGGLSPGILTVGEGDGFLRGGGMIAFVLEEHHVRFDINHRAAAKAYLNLSSRLLGVARSVRK